MSLLRESETMKTKIIFALVAIGGILGFTGCKPKTTTLTGQVFIATQGGDNVKLGDVEILLIEKSQASDFLKQKQPLFESETASRQKEFLDAKETFEKVQSDYDLFTAENKNKGFSTDCDDHKFLTNNLFATDTNCIKIKSQAETFLRQADALGRYALQLNAQQERAEAQGNYETSEALKMREYAVDGQEEKAETDANVLLEQLDKVVMSIKAEKYKRLEALGNQFGHAKQMLTSFPSCEDYLADFSPIVIQKTLSDADGKFSFTYPRNQLLTIYTSAQRSILNRTERYYWLIDAPTNADTVQVFLSNNNLVYADPDGYFKLKPKRSP
jgi:hypothetical protein